MNRRRMQLVLAFGVLSLFAAVGVAAAGGWRDSTIREHLTGYEETPLALSTPASGEFSARVDNRRQEINYRLSYRDTPTAVTQAHIHFGSESQSGGISVFFCTNLGNGPVGTQACPPAPATVTGTIRAADVIGPAGQGIAAGEFEELVDAMRAGMTYANVHTTERPAGEIRAKLEFDRDHDD